MQVKTTTFKTAKIPATMTSDKYIDLITPEADRQPSALRCALSSYAAAESLSIDLTANTLPPVSARGIADDINDRRGGDARNDSDRPPDLPRLHETRENARSNSSRSRALAPVAPVTNSSSSPRRKKSRSSQRRFRGKENSSSDVSAFDSPGVENRKSPFCPQVENRKAPLFLVPKPTPRGSETLPPAVVDLAGKNSPIALSVSRMDSDTLSESRLDSVRVPIQAGTNPFGGPREIPRKKKDGVFFGQFLPQVQIPADHPRGDEIRRAAAFLHALPAYKHRSDYIEHRIWILIWMDPSQVTHHAEAIAKRPTIRLGVSDECFTYCNPGANMNECPSFRATHACSDGLPPTGIDYGNGLRFCVTNA